MKCHLCEKEFDLDQLVKHIGRHFVKNSNSPQYRCTINNCNQCFQNASSFKRHVKTKHKSIENRTESGIERTQNQTINTIESLPEIVSNKSLLDNVFDPTLKTFNFDSCVENVKMSALKFIVSLHDKDFLPRKEIVNIQNSIINDLLDPIFYNLKEIISNYILNSSQLTYLNHVIKLFANPFDYCKSEHMLIENLIKNDMAARIPQFTINAETQACLLGGELKIDDSTSKGLIYPLSFYFRKIFEKEDVLRDCLFEIQKLENSFSGDCISHFVQGQLWKEKKINIPNKILIPYFIHCDDLEINNCLGSHAGVHSLAAIYYSFPLSENISQLTNIFLAGVIKTKDTKEFGNDSCLYKLIDEIKILEDTGILIKLSDGTSQRVHFVLGLILGDNLGLNKMLNFSKSFSANFFCRFCTEGKRSTVSLCEEKIESLLNIDKYEMLLEKNDPSATGIYGDSIFNSISSFHVVKNYSVDIMHDVFEGICQYNMVHILNHYTQRVKLFTLATLNDRIYSFNYGPIDVGNKIGTPIKIENLKNKHLKMSASEMMTFVHFFPLIIGDLINENDEVWSFFLLFLNIVDILMSYNFTENILDHLKLLIKEHNSQFIKLFKDTLKPKYHILTHYPFIIRQSGPPRLFWSMRYESKHREIKTYARVINSRKNITLTICKKFMFKYVNYFLSPKNCVVKVNSRHKIHSNFENFITQQLNVSVENLDIYSQIEYKGTLYKKDFYLHTFKDNFSFYNIIEIIVTKFDKFFILCDEITDYEYHLHYDSYELKNYINQYENITIKNISDFRGFPINIHNTTHKKNMVRLKDAF